MTRTEIEIDPPSDIPDRTRDVWRVLVASDDPPTKYDIADELGLAPATVRSYIEVLQQAGYAVHADDQFQYHLDLSEHVTDDDGAADETAVDDADSGGVDAVRSTTADADASTDDQPGVPDIESVPVDPDADPSAESLTDREHYIATELQTGATIDELAADLDERESVITQHLRDLKRQGWRVYFDDDADGYTIEGDHALRSSEHKGTRTRKANRWWEIRHNELVREFRSLEWPDATLSATAGNEDWVLHLTDVHAGDRVRTDDGTTVYETDMVPSIIDYVTRKALALADKHGSSYDTAHILWGGDMLTNEGIYEGQFEDLDAWLDEQHDTLVAPLIRQVKAFSERFPTVQIVCQVGNHGRNRASGTSRQANADLILYKQLRNIIAAIREYADDAILANVNFVLGEAKNYRNFELRGGDLAGHLRHGQDTKPQAVTAAGKRDWRGWLLDHEFDLAAVGHHHISGRVPWDGPPVIFSGSPKPAGEFVESLGGRPATRDRDIATTFGVADEGLTAVYPIDTRDFEDPVLTAGDLSEWEWGRQEAD